MENYDLMPVFEVNYGDLRNNPFAKNDDKRSRYTVIQHPCESELDKDSDKDSDEDLDEDLDEYIDEEDDIDDMAGCIRDLVIYVTARVITSKYYAIDCAFLRSKAKQQY